MADFRVIDTGCRGGRANVAFDQALVDAHREGLIPDTIRFLRFRPSALVGAHQVLSHEVRLDYCRAHGIEVGRRITGGGGLYLDQGQIGWELVFHRRSLGSGDLGALTRAICEAAALGLRRLGVDAAYRPRNDIEVDGRKISGTGGLFDGDTIFYQGTLLIDFDVRQMISALKVPAEKLGKHDLASAEDRVVSLRQLLGHTPPLAEIYQALLDGFAERLGIRATWDAVRDVELRLAAAVLREEVGTDAFVHMHDAPEADDTLVTASLTKDAGTIRADVRLEGRQRDRVREVLLTGDFLLAPPRAIRDLEAALRGLARNEVGPAVDAFFRDHPVDCLGLGAAEFREVLEAALRQVSIRTGGHAVRGHLIGPAPGNGQNPKPTLVFLHDALGCGRLWRDVPHLLVEATGLGALVYDRWGSGDSDPLTRPFSKRYLLDEALGRLPDILDAAGIREAILVGHSDGAAIALAFAGAHPERVRGVIAEAPHLFPEPRTVQEIRAQIDDFEHGDLKARLARYHGSRTEALFTRLVEAWTDEGRRDWGITPYVRNIRCPVLAIQGDDDEYFTRAQIDTITEAVPGPVDSLIVPKCGHVPHHQQRDDVLPAMARFIRGLTAAVPRPAPMVHQPGRP